jgi:hypothetical protein
MTGEYISACHEREKVQDGQLGWYVGEAENGELYKRLLSTLDAFLWMIKLPSLEGVNTTSSRAWCHVYTVYSISRILYNT